MAKIATDKSEVTMLTSDNPKNEDPCMCSRPCCVTKISLLQSLLLNFFHFDQWRSWMTCWLVWDGQCRII